MNLVFKNKILYFMNFDYCYSLFRIFWEPLKLEYLQDKNEPSPKVTSNVMQREDEGGHAA